MNRLFGYFREDRKYRERIDDIQLDEATEARIAELGISRRGLLTSLAAMASMMALPQTIVPQFAAAATSPQKPRVLFVSFQECTGCLESLINSFAFKGGATIENLLLNLISLDYQETLMASAGVQSDQRLLQSVAAPGYVLVVDGSVPAAASSGYFVSSGRSGVALLNLVAQNAAAIVAVGTCASFGGLPKASPNPTGAVSVGTVLKSLGINKPVINVSGCPPIAEVITGTILYYLTTGVPPLDSLGRPTMFFGRTVHEHCYREDHYEDGPWVGVFDDTNARFGGCLYHMGCKGPVTHNACSTVGWNQGTSFPIMSGHGCIGCAEPDFWDRVNPNGKKGLYQRGPGAD